jgi:FKBP-type peptidyl-prolyl cis-trans isomerase FkpA
MRQPSLHHPVASWLVTAIVALSLAGTACSRRDAAAPTLPAAAGAVSTLHVTDEVVGDGVTAAPGSRVTVHYTGWLYDQRQPGQKGAPFDSSREGGRPFQFELGAGQVIAGWDQGVQGMRVGGRRRLVVPAALAYGDSGAGGVIPPGASLVFDVELLAVEPAGG